LRHFVNIALLLFFATLLVSGLLRFLAPFSLVTTRVHIVFGIGVAVLVALHLVERTKYFKQILGLGKKRSVSQTKAQASKRQVPLRMLSAVIGLWLVLLVAALWDYPPASSLISLSYESRHRRAIFRPDPKAVFQPVKDGARVKRATASDANLLVELEWGPAFESLYRRASLPFADARPQIAVWAESQNGSLIETLFLSERVAYREQLEWAGHPMRRVHVLPVWRHRYTLKTGVTPDGEIDAYSGATPEHSFSLHNNLKTEGEPFYLYIEINAPKDPNSFFNSEQNSDKPGYMKPGIGQPSVIYGAYIEPKQDKQYLLLDLIGHGGSTNKQDGNIHYETAQLTSAKQLVEKILVRVTRTETSETKNSKQNAATQASR
jgi:hypothetical protein